MKRFFPIIISLILICSMIFTGCDSGEEKAEISAKDALSVNQELLETSFTTDETAEIQYTFSKLKDIIIKWADENNINVEFSPKK